MNILFAVHDWGLGHATRDLVLIRALVAAGNSVTILSTARALKLLQYEMGHACDFVELPDIPKPLSRQAFWFYVKMSLDLPIVFWTFWHEHRFVRDLCRTRKFDRIVSDTRYGVFSRDIPSYFIVHSLRQIIPGRPFVLEGGVEAVQQRLLDGARKILIPDQECDGLAGDLCHNLALNWNGKLEYMGILSSVRRQQVEPDIDYFITVSGAEPQRTIFEEIVLAQAHGLPGRVVITLGRPDKPYAATDDGRVAVHSYMTRAQQEEAMNRARLVVSRSGYTTLMELAELGKRALFVPTVGQSEQEYLGTYHEKLGNMHTVLQRNLDLARDVAAAERYRGIRLAHPTQETVNQFLATVSG
ncbi:MAG: glycosyltransferase [Dehalococcoidales bacterium]|nr:glycosyltransferase [Dehalococcoidales bacterium]